MNDPPSSEDQGYKIERRDVNLNLADYGLSSSRKAHFGLSAPSCLRDRRACFLCLCCPNRRSTQPGSTSRKRRIQPPDGRVFAKLFRRPTRHKRFLNSSRRLIRPPPIWPDGIGQDLDRDHKSLIVLANLVVRRSVTLGTASQNSSGWGVPQTRNLICLHHPGVHGICEFSMKRLQEVLQVLQEGFAYICLA